MSTHRVGRYRLDGVLGAGSFATVHRAVDDALQASVVVKILAENHSIHPEIRERFIAEGRSLRRVASPHVVTVHDIGESERQQPYLVLEYADRGTLAERVSRLDEQGWKPSRDDVLEVARSLAAALEAVHSAQLVHRDLSPNNVLIRSVAGAGGSGEPAGGHAPGGASLLAPDERILVADLGMCKDLALNSGLTVAGGTNGFRPPEMTGGPALVDTRADLWSLSALLEWVCESDDGSLPEEFRATLRRSLADDPDDRHTDVASWLADVEAALAPAPPAEEARSDEDAPDGGDLSRTAPATGRWRRVAVVAAVLLAGLLAGALLTTWSSAPPAATSTARIAIEGPEEVVVGEPAEFTARHLGVRSWVWELPTGEYVSGTDTVTITAVSPGSAQLTLRARDSSGEDLEYRHRIRATE